MIVPLFTNQVKTFPRVENAESKALILVALILIKLQSLVRESYKYIETELNLYTLHTLESVQELSIDRSEIDASLLSKKLIS